MKPHLLREPERWSERGGGASVEDAIGASFRQIMMTTQPSDAAVTRWARRAMTAPAPRAAAGRVWAIATAAAILAGGGAVAARVAWRAAVIHAPTPAPHPAPTPPAGGRRHAWARSDAPPAVPPPAEPAPALELPAAAPPPAPPRIARAPRWAPDPTPLTEPPALAAEADDEARLLARAFRHLRNEGDAAAALAALDQRQRRFGAGALGTEAALARAEALLLLGRTDDALPLLLALRDTHAGLTPEVRAVRAELLARARRCPEALTDFDALLASGAPEITRERALYGRASCRLQGVAPDGARPDLERYLAEYPEGRFAAAVRAALESLRHL